MTLLPRITLSSIASLVIRNNIHGRRIASSSIFRSQRGDERSVKQDINLSGIDLDDIEELMSDDILSTLSSHYPKLGVYKSTTDRPFTGHNLVVVQPWDSYANFDEYTNPDLQLAECVSLANTIHNWKVIGKKVIFSKHINKKQIFGPRAFDEFKEFILGHSGVSAVFFGLQLLSGVQLATLERGLRLPCYDRYTMVLNIFKQHANTKEAKIQIALAELPYIRSHLREIHESSEFSSSADSLKMLIGGVGEKFYHHRLNILKKRERRLRELLKNLRDQREVMRKQRLRKEMPTVSVVGYTNSGKTSLIKYLTQDDNLVPRDQLFATLDVTVHAGQLPSCKDVLYIDTVGFISRIPTLLIEAFSATLRDIQDSDLIIHVLDVNHPDHRLQFATVLNSLKSLEIPKKLMETKITVGNKIDLLPDNHETKNSPDHCDVHVSVTKGTNLQHLIANIDSRLTKNLGCKILTIRVENGGRKYNWLRKNSTILACHADESDHNYLICEVSMSSSSIGRWRKDFSDTPRI